MGRIADFLGAPQSSVRRRPNQVIIQGEEPTIDQVRPPRQAPDERVMGARLEQQPIRREVPEEQPRIVIMVNRDQDADEVIHRVRRENMMENDLTSMIERIMAQNGLNIGFQRPNYSSPLSEYVLQTELPRGCKIPKFTRFSGDTSESTIEHIARYMTEAGDLADSSVERLKSEKARANKNYKKERVAYVEFEDGESEISEDPYGLEEFKVDLAELKEAPPYACKLLTPSNGRNPVEIEKSDRFPKKTYTFDVTKCDEIFDLLVKDGQMIVPPNTKIPPLEQRKKRGFCKYHNFLGHKTSQCFLFRDLIQNAIRDGRLKFADKGKNQMKVDADPLNIAEINYAELIEINTIDVGEVEAVKATGTEGYAPDGKQATDGLNKNVSIGISVKGKQDANVEPMATEGLKGKATEATEGLRKKFEEISITDGASLGVNMVDLKQPPPPQNGGSG
ncbi:uncharacterized protein LOC127104002 [Lathyrus oleraceus]|uniref:uncharacterized protein LOC127104002 n=1 Tax=Pisum sativum TaxID=3888 RepID=UPI0021CEA29F|nr:uncharacterized protein LOC127104002 [Pisum sativum]